MLLLCPQQPTTQQLVEKLQNEAEIIQFQDGTDREIPRPLDKDVLKKNTVARKKDMH